MNIMSKLSIVICFLFLFVLCKNSATSYSPIASTETWRLAEPKTQNYAEVIINKHEDGSLSCTGVWFYTFWGNNVTCQIMNGSVKKNDFILTFDCSGTASYPPNKDGYEEKSDFVLIMTGQFSNGVSSGSWDIQFFKPSWNTFAPSGDFNGTKLDGTGVTE